MRNRQMHRAVASSTLVFLLALACSRSFDGASMTASRFANRNASVSCPKLKGALELVESQEVLVTKIADGDTFTACVMPEMKGSIRVRVLGIDCPESRQNAKCKRDGKQGRLSCAEQIPLGKEASALAHSLLKNKIVSLESPRNDGVFERDIFGRWLAYVRTENERDYGMLMIENGHCENYHWKYPHPRAADYGHIQRP